jgi:hypothetical protein
MCGVVGLPCICKQTDEAAIPSWEARLPYLGPRIVPVSSLNEKDRSGFLGRTEKCDVRKPVPVLFRDHLRSVKLTSAVGGECICRQLLWTSRTDVDAHFHNGTRAD